MKTFYVVLVKPKAKFVPFSWIIRLFQGTKYSHCEFNFNISNRNMYYGAVKPSVRLSNEHYFLEKYEIIKKFSITLEDELFGEIRAMVMEYSNSPYPVLETICLGISKLFGLKKNFYCDSRYLKCSELLVRFLSKVADIKRDPEMTDVRDVDMVLTRLSTLDGSNIKLVYEV